MGRAFTPKQRQIIWNKDKGICGICKRKVHGNWQADHVYPWSLGGLTTIENGQVSHPVCNQRKYTDPDFEDVGWNRNWRVWWELCRFW